MVTLNCAIPHGKTHWIGHPVHEIAVGKRRIEVLCDRDIRPHLEHNWSFGKVCAGDLIAEYSDKNGFWLGCFIRRIK